MDREVVWLNEQRCFAWLVYRGAYFSTVEIPGEGTVTIENDDYDLWEERAIEYDESE